MPPVDLGGNRALCTNPRAGSGQWGGGGGGGGGGFSHPAAQPPSRPATQPPSHLVT